MTTIVAVWTPHGAAIAGDRRVVCGSAAYVRGRPKVRRAAPWLLAGFTGGAFEDDFVHRLTVPDDVDSLDRAYDVLHEALDPWRDTKRDGVGDFVGVTPWGVLLADEPGFVTVLGSASGRVVTHGAGTGGQAARGALEAFGSMGIDARGCVTRAMEIATLVDTYTGAPFDVLTLDAA